MRLFNSFLVALTALLAAGSAGALVIINHVTTGSTVLAPGQTFDVQVRLTWDGQGALQGVHSSTVFDSSLLELVGNTTAPASILSFTDPDPAIGLIPGLSRLTTQINLPGDPADILRTVQYGALSPVDSRAATTVGGRLITTLTFKWIGSGGITDIRTLLADGDVGAVGDTFQAGTAVTVAVIPEPGTAILMGLGLAGLGFTRWHGARRS